jgi:hypothetical protein
MVNLWKSTRRITYLCLWLSLKEILGIHAIEPAEE